MSKTIINTPQAPAPIGPYNQAVLSGNTLYMSGQVCIDPVTGELKNGSIEEETEQVMKNVEAVLAAGGMKFENVVKTTIFLTSMADFPVVNEIYGRFFPNNPPARSTVAVAGLPKGVNVEIEVVAYKA